MRVATGSTEITTGSCTGRDGLVLGYNRLVDHVGIHGQRRLTEPLNKDSLVRQKEYLMESSSKSRKSGLLQEEPMKGKNCIDLTQIGCNERHRHMGTKAPETVGERSDDLIENGKERIAERFWRLWRDRM
ncbi:hypothetical protein Taro_041308 [Colocasia esculenta]|uniref:Uncharacterized protein n=1 Tax=Colocasia esculenta TaxID=4460 RepID=A0A843WE18_COLES|nr:hypothetical protein [Colocasia esculenta]